MTGPREEMRRRAPPDLGSAHAIILHRPNPAVDALTRQLAAIGLDVSACWPELPETAPATDYIFFDADLGHDEQFPWAPGASPMPLIALIGTEAPGRIAWAMAQGACGQILKPVSDAGVYSALLIAREVFEQRAALSAHVASLERRLGARQTVVQAVALLGLHERGAGHAYNRLRQLAMVWRVPIEDAAHRIVAHGRDPVDEDPVSPRHRRR